MSAAARSDVHLWHVDALVRVLKQIVNKELQSGAVGCGRLVGVGVWFWLEVWVCLVGSLGSTYSLGGLKTLDLFVGF